MFPKIKVFEMAEAKADFIVGGVARSDDFYFRKTFIDDVLDSLKKDNVLLLSPRRTGKTSVMYYLLDYCQAHFKVIHLNVEDLDSPVEFYLSLIDAINEHQPEYLKQLASTWGVLKSIGKSLEEIGFMDFKVKLREADNWDENWKKLAQELIDRVIQEDVPVLFIIDELPDMLSAMKENSEKELVDFLHQFKRIRTAAKNGKIRWLVGGSVNITGVLDEMGKINLINDLKSEPLPTLTRKEVTGFIRTMLDERAVKYHKNLIPKVYELLGEPIPYFLQLFTQELYRYSRREKLEILTEEHAEIVFKHSLLGEAAHDKLQHYYSRIRLYYPDREQETAYDLLSRLSQVEVGISEGALFVHYQKIQSTQATETVSKHLQAQAFKRLLLKLESDFYVSKSDDDQYQFNSHLLKTWWRKNWAYISEVS